VVLARCAVRCGLLRGHLSFPFFGRMRLMLFEHEQGCGRVALERLHGGFCKCLGSRKCCGR